MGGFCNTSAVESATCGTGKAQTITDTTGNGCENLSAIAGRFLRL